MVYPGRPTGLIAIEETLVDLEEATDPDAAQIYIGRLLARLTDEGLVSEVDANKPLAAMIGLHFGELPNANELRRRIEANGGDNALSAIEKEATNALIAMTRGMVHLVGDTMDLAFGPKDADEVKTDVWAILQWMAGERDVLAYWARSDLGLVVTTNFVLLHKRLLPSRRFLEDLASTHGEVIDELFRNVDDAYSRKAATLNAEAGRDDRLQAQSQRLELTRANVVRVHDDMLSNAETVDELESIGEREERVWLALRATADAMRTLADGARPPVDTMSAIKAVTESWQGVTNDPEGLAVLLTDRPSASNIIFALTALSESLRWLGLGAVIDQVQGSEARQALLAVCENQPPEQTISGFGTGI